MEKTCKSCGQSKPTSAFHKDKSKPDGLNFYCKPCHKDRQAKYNLRPPRNPAPEGMKRCGHCKEDKLIAEFYPDTKMYLGVQRRCKECSKKIFREYADRQPNWKEKNAVRSKKWREANPELAADHKRKSKYQLSLGEYNRMLATQNGLCAICETDRPGGRGGFHVDHCHSTGRIRGLLCNSCNTGLGKFSDNQTLLQRAINYLKNN